MVWFWYGGFVHKVVPIGCCPRIVPEMFLLAEKLLLEFFDKREKVKTNTFSESKRNKNYLPTVNVCQLSKKYKKRSLKLNFFSIKYGAPFLAF